MGRLTLAELDERLGWTYAAKTMGDLRKITSDLPNLASQGVDLDKSPPCTSAEPPLSRDQPRDRERCARDVERAQQRSSISGWTSSRAIWGSYLSVNLILVVIWFLSAVTSDGGGWYPWFLWVAGPWGVALLGNEIQRRTHGDRST